MSAAGGGFERAFGAFLPFDLLKIGTERRGVDGAGRGRGENLGSFEVIDELDEALGRDDRDIVARPRSYSAAGGGTDQPKVLRIRRYSRRKRASDGATEPSSPSSPITA